MSNMNLNGSTEVYQDVSFQLAVGDAKMLLDNLKQHTFPPWKRDTDWEGFVKRNLNEPAEVLAFYRQAKGDDGAVHLSIHGKYPQDWFIPNVVPEEIGNRLTVHRYNEIINEFVHHILMPAVRPLKVKIELTPRKLWLNDLMSETSVKALKSFLALGDGVASAPHPADERRLCHFIWSIHENDPDFNTDRFHQWLEDGCSWPSEFATNLAKRVDEGLVLLDERPSHVRAE